MNNTVRIIIAESSVIIRSGLDHALKHIPQLAVDVIGVSTMDMLNDSINIYNVIYTFYNGNICLIDNMHSIS